MQLDLPCLACALQLDGIKETLKGQVAQADQSITTAARCARAIWKQGLKRSMLLSNYLHQRQLQQHHLQQFGRRHEFVYTCLMGVTWMCVYAHSLAWVGQAT